MKNIFLSLAIVSAAASSCGRQQSANNTSKLDARSQVPTENIAATDVQNFIDQAATIRDSSGVGAIPVLAFLKLMPLLPHVRGEILKSFKNDFKIACNDATNICSVATTGSPTQAVMNVVIDGVPNPSLVLESSVTSDFIIRDQTSIEFCNTRGLSVKKLFLKKTVQGLFLSASSNQAQLTVNTGNDSENYSCL